MSNKLTAFYDNLVKLCGLTLGDHGRLGVVTEEGVTYLQYDGKHLVFPEKQYMNSPENEDIIILHPLSESVIRGVSEVQDLLRRAAILHLNTLGRIILDKAIQLNYDISQDKSFKPNHKLSELFASIGEIDEQFFNFWQKLQKEMLTNSKARLFDVYLKSHGEIGTRKYDRICSIASPMYDEIILNNNKRVFDIEAPRKKDINILKSILLALFPPLEQGGFIVGSSESVAPYLNAFIDALVEIENRFNEIILAFGKDANDLAGVWCNGIDIKRDVDISKIRNLLPADKPYNIGVPKDKEKELAESKPNRKPASTRPNPLLDSLSKDNRRDDAIKEEDIIKDDNVPFWMQEERGGRRDEYRSSRYEEDDRNERRSSRRGSDRYDDRRDDSRYGRSDRRSDRRSTRYEDDRSSRRSNDYEDVPYWMR